MRWPFTVLLALAAFPGGRLASQQPAQKEVTLNEAVERALQVQPAMVQARGDQRSAGAAIEPRLVSPDRVRQRLFPENWRDPIQLFDQPNADASRFDGLQRRTERESG